MKNSGSFIAITILLLLQNTLSATTELEGVWEGSGFHTFFGLSYIFNFKGDSLFITEKFCNDVPDNCHNSRCYNTFYTCSFRMIHDSLLIKGHCADSTFKVNINNTGCRFGPTEVCEYTLNKRFLLSQDTVFLFICDEDCADKLIKKNSGVKITRSVYTPVLKSSDCNLRIDNNKVFLELPHKQSFYDLKIATIQGKVVYRESLISRYCFFGVFSPGVYLLSVKNTYGTTVNRTFHINGY